MVIAIGLWPSAAGELKSMNREFEGIYQVAKKRYNLYYTVNYKLNSCILRIFRDGNLIILVNEETQERMYDLAAERLKGYVKMNEKNHA